MAHVGGGELPGLSAGWDSGALGVGVEQVFCARLSPTEAWTSLSGSRWKKNPPVPRFARSVPSAGQTCVW
ncbi:hypothetical protein ACFVIZ_28620 [Streptomyces anulatus]|uniref:hypothetical protein n=1 Tax=Streptomyces anulatus TaxID=1892 RepID=UPI0036250CAA